MTSDYGYFYDTEFDEFIETTTPINNFEYYDENYEEIESIEYDKLVKQFSSLSVFSVLFILFGIQNY